MVTKVEAASIANAAGITDRAHQRRRRSRRRLAGEDVGTVFAPTGSRRASRKLWLAHATTPRGRLLLDDGRGACGDRAPHVAAARRHHRGRGRLRRRRPGRRCAAPTGTVIGRGLVNYSSAELPGCSGARPTTWPASSGRSTSARSSTATTSSSSDGPEPPRARRLSVSGACVTSNCIRGWAMVSCDCTSCSSRSPDSRVFCSRSKTLRRRAAQGHRRRRRSRAGAR